MQKIIIVSAVAILLLIGSSWVVQKPTETPVQGNVVSKNGLHWHPKIEIFVKGEQLIIPEGIGLASGHMPIHTHDDLPLIHMEFGGPVMEDDVTLGVFFNNWGKDIHSFGNTMIMKVNGVENSEYENYHMKDGDSIQLYYE